MPRGQNLIGVGGGRPKGRKNKRTLEIREMFGADMEKGITRALDIINDPDTPIEKVLFGVSILMPYFYAKKTPINNQTNIIANSNTIESIQIMVVEGPGGE